jgi:hypothetical protein
MKKVLVFILFIFIIFSGRAQFFYGGIRAGANGSQVSGDRLSGFDKFGIHGGLYAGVHLSKASRMQFEMLFMQKGSRQNAKPDKGIYSSYLLRLNYIELPLMYIWRGNSYFEVEGGFSYGRLMSNTDIEWDENGLMPGMTPFKNDEFSVQLGFNYLLNENMRVNFRLNNSILPVREHTGGATYRLNRGQYNTVLMLGINYLFGISEKGLN